MDRLNSRELKIFLTVFLVLGLFIQWYGVNANSRLDLTLAVVNDGEANTNDYYWHAGDRSYFEGDYYSDKEPGMAFLATPIYAGWKSVYGSFGNTSINTANRTDWFRVNSETLEYMEEPGNFYLSSLILVLLLTSTLSLSLLTVLIYRMGGELVEDERKRLLLTFGFAFGTIVTHYGANFMPNAVVTFLSFLSFYLVYDNRKYLTGRLFLFSGIIGGFAVVVDPTAAPVLAGTFFYGFLKSGIVPYPMIAGGIIGASPMLIYNTLVFGYPWMLPRFHLDPALYPNIQQASSAIPKLTEQGFRLDPIRMFFTAKKLLFYPYRGIFYWFPVLILSLFGVRSVYREDRELVLTTGIVMGGVVFMVAGWWAWWMGGFFGARYLSVTVPFLMIAVFKASENINFRILTAVVLISVMVNLSGFQGPYEDQHKDLQNSSEMNPEVADKVDSFETLGNPVSDYYLEGLLERGPQSRIINGLYNGEFPPDIRAYTPYEDRAPHTLLLGAVLAILTGIWRTEIKQKTESIRRDMEDPG